MLNYIYKFKLIIISLFVFTLLINNLKSIIVKEHRFNIPQLKDHLGELGLKFCGFETKAIVSHFQQTNKDKERIIRYLKSLSKQHL